MPFVVIEVAPSDVAAEHRTAMVEACTRAVQPGQCALSGSVPAAETTAIAIVSWEGPDFRAARIQVGLKNVTKDNWLSRDLHFQSTDAPEERWRAVGFAIGTLAQTQEPETVQVEPKPAPPPPKPISRPAPPTRFAPKPVHPPLAQRWVALGGMVGPGLDQGGWRSGVWLRAANRLGASPVLAQISGSYALRPEQDQLSVQWGTLGAGLGWTDSVAGPRLDWTLSLDVFLEQIRAQAQNPQNSETDRRSHWTPGIRATAIVGWPTSSPVSLVVGGEVWRLWGGTAINVGGHRVGLSTPTNAGILLGLRVTLP